MTDHVLWPSFQLVALLNITCSSTKQVTSSPPKDERRCIAASDATCSLRFETIKYQPLGISTPVRSASGISSRSPVGRNPNWSRTACGGLPLTANHESE